MRRAWLVWLLYAICVLVALPALVWLTLAALRLEHAERQARQQAEREEEIRLASWRLDSTLMGIVGPEAARPYADVTAQVRGELVPGAGRLRPPPSEYVLAYFEATPGGVTISANAGEQPRQERFRGLTRLGELLSRLPREMLPAADAAGTEQLAAVERGLQWFTQQSDQQVAPAAAEDDFSKRQEFNAKNTARALVQQRAAGAGFEKLELREGVSRPLWLGDELVIARRVQIGGAEIVQGCWLDWQRLHRDLRAELSDLSPRLDLLPAKDEADVNFSRALATLPVELSLGETELPPAGWTPLRAALVVGWCGLALAAVAAAALLAGVVALGQRRAAFVSAVTHELRTPLTTFRMYSEMLDEGMVADASQRKHYTSTLRREADRLWHLVENVLAYARLERGKADGRRQQVTLAELWRRTQPRLVERARAADMELALAMDAAAHGTTVQTDPAAVEQILFNLVDNACKYAAATTVRTIHVQMAAADGRATIAVCDHGPGIRPAEAGRLFRPFSKSAAQAAHSAPGVGLGLALCRRLARQMGGDLRYVNGGEAGATFVLELPVG